MIHWNSFAEFVAMGGYGFYVWGSFGVTALIMPLNRLWSPAIERPPLPG
jgi:heme exporter protein D